MAQSPSAGTFLGAPGVAESPCIYVLSDLDGCKYKLVMQGDLRLLTVDKIKRYLHSATGLDPSRQALTLNGRLLHPSDSGAAIGLYDGCTMRLQHVNSQAVHPGKASPAALSTAQSARPQLAQPSNLQLLSGASAHALQPPQRGSTLLNMSNMSDPTSLNLVPDSTLRGPGGVRSATPQPHPPNASILATMAHSSEQPGPGARYSAPSSPFARPAAPASPGGGGGFGYSRERFLEEENRRLTERLRNAEVDSRRREHQLLEEVNILRHEVDRLEREKSDLERAEHDRKRDMESAAERQKRREDDFVRDLELLREERRKMKQEQLSLEEEQRALVYNLESQIHSQRREIAEQEALIGQLRLELQQQVASVQPGYTGGSLTPRRSQADLGRSSSVNVAENLQRSLLLLARQLRLDAAKLRLDDNLTCVVSVTSTLSILLTFDPNTERLFLYSTLLNELPRSDTVKLRLYETLLEGALLGRGMAGGGVGISLKNDIVIMGTSLDMRHCDENALATVSVPFIEAVDKWVVTSTSLVRGREEEEGEHANGDRGVSASHDAARTSSRGGGGGYTRAIESSSGDYYR